jgi:hypothetical protein
MYVWVLERGEDHDGHSIKGIFQSREKAEQAAAELRVNIMEAWHKSGWIWQEELSKIGVSWRTGPLFVSVFRYKIEDLDDEI